MVVVEVEDITVAVVVDMVIVVAVILRVEVAIVEGIGAVLEVTRRIRMGCRGWWLFEQKGSWILFPPYMTEW